MIIFGDTHDGNCQTVKNMLNSERFDIRDEDLVIIGDCGIGFPDTGLLFTLFGININDLEFTYAQRTAVKHLFQYAKDSGLDISCMTFDEIAKHEAESNLRLTSDDVEKVDYPKLGLTPVAEAKVKRILSCGNTEGLKRGLFLVSEYKEQIRQQVNLQLNAVNDWLIERNCRLYLLRGNHDNPIFWEEPPTFSHITFLQDGINFIGEVKAFCINGASSVDSLNRTPDLDHFLLEIINLPEVKRLVTKTSKQDFKNVRLILSHECPASQYPLLRDNKERQFLQTIYEVLKTKITHPVTWCYGHHHDTYINVEDNFTFRLINKNDFIPF